MLRAFASSLLLFAAVSLLAQSSPHVNIPVIAARAEDVASPEAIVRTDLETISGTAGVPRQWGRNYSLYDPHAYFVSMSTDPKTGAIKKNVMTLQEYADRSDAHLVANGLVERELGHHVYRYGNVATVLSSYESKIAGKITGRGVNIYQLFYDGKRWWIASVVWDQERADNPIPKDLLTTK